MKRVLILLLTLMLICACVPKENSTPDVETPSPVVEEPSEQIPQAPVVPAEPSVVPEQAPSVPYTAAQIPFKTVSKAQYSGVKSEGVQAVTSQAELEVIWKQIHARKITLPELPQYNFVQNMMLLVSTGEQKSGGYDIEVLQVEETLDKIVVKVGVTEPSKDSVVTQALTQPYHLVMLARIPKEPKLEVIEMAEYVKYS